VLTDDHNFYNGTSSIVNYLKNVFVEDAEGKVTVNPRSMLRGASYTDALTVINFASAFSSYNEYIIRNNITMPTDVAKQKELAIKYFNTVDYTAAGYHDKTGGGGMTFPSMAHAVVAMGSLMGQKDTARFETLIKNAYDNHDNKFWDQSGYINAFNQLCADYSWFDKSKIKKVGTELAASDILYYYAFGVNVAKEYPELWKAWVETALANNALDATEAKVFAYHYAYQLTGGDVDLGVYGSSRAIVDFSKFQ